MLFHVALVQRTGTPGKLLLSYFFAGLRSDKGALAPEAEDAWEQSLEAATRQSWNTAAPVTLCCAGHTVLVAGYGSDMTMLVTGLPPADELELLEAHATLSDLFTTACDSKATAQQVLAFHGKLVLCLAAAYSPVCCISTDSEKVARQAKLKAI